MLYNMLYNIYLQLGVLPELDAESLGLFTASERILQDFAETKHVDATFIKDLIQKVLHHPDFDPAEVDHDMHQRLMGAIAEGDKQQRPSSVAGRSVGMINVSASAAAARGAEGCPMSEIWCYMTCYVTCYM